MRDSGVGQLSSNNDANYKEIKLKQNLYQCKQKIRRSND